MARVFVSHASEDIAVARELHRWLAECGHEVFLDQDLHDGIAVGEEWEKRLQERLRWANAMVCVVTSAYSASSWCLAEVRLARSRGNRLLPVRAEAGITHALLRSIQHTDLTRDRMTAHVALDEALRRIDEAGDPDWPDDRSPFPGLRPFDAEDHCVFFARAHEIEQLAELLRSTAERAEGAVLLVVGPSGSGKSSLLRAGLLPAMAGEPGWWTLPPIVPGIDPVAALARELAAASRDINLNWSLEYIRHELGKNSLTVLAEELLAALGSRAQRLLVVVDQFEELLIQTSPANRTKFAELLRPALTGPVRVVGTLRPEFLDQLLGDSALATLPTDIYPLRPLHRDGLRLVIEQPARLAGIAVEERLVARMVDDTDSGDALPLLAFTLAQLADGIRRGGQLSTARYEELGGVQGALIRQANAALTEATTAGGRSREEVIAGLMWLITVDEQGRPTRWRILRDHLPAPVIAALNPFITRRLVTTDTDNGSTVIGVAHEAFLSAWPPLAAATTASSAALRARRTVEQAATEWDNDRRPPGRLWERGQLAAAVTDTGAHIKARDLVTQRVELSQTARAFLRSSIRRDRFRRGRAITILSMLLVLALVAAGYAFAQQRTAEQQRNVAISRQVAGQAIGLKATNPALAAQLAAAAYQLAPTTEARGSLLTAFANPYSTRLTGHTSVVRSTAFSPSGLILATGSADDTVRLWDVSDPHHPTSLGTLTGHVHVVLGVAFSSDGHTVATGSYDNTARLWDVSDPHRPTSLGTLTGHTSGVYSVAFSPDGNTLVTAGADHTARLWDITDPRHPTPLGTPIGHTGTITSVDLSPDGNTLVTAGADHTARLWDVNDPAHAIPLGTVTGHTSNINGVAFSPDGHILATAGADKTARLWDVSDSRNPALMGTLTGHTNGVYSVAFGSGGHIVATSSGDSTARLWDVSEPRRPYPLGVLAGHTGGVYSVAFNSEGNVLATASDDSTARLWDLPGPIMAGHIDGVSRVAFSPNRHTIATTSDDHTARLWDVRDPHHPSPLSILVGHTDGVLGVAFSSDGHTLATAGADHTARLWDVRDARQPSPLGTLTGHAGIVIGVAFSSDGHTLATAGADHTARLWDVSDPRHPRPLAVLTDHSNGVFRVTFNPDGHILATASADHTARLWDVTDPQHPSPLGTLTGHASGVSSVAFSSDGHILATAGVDHTARLWDVTDPRHPSPLGTLIGHTSGVNGVTFGSGGHTLATSSIDSTARLWDVRDPRHPSPLATLTGHTNGVFSVVFSSDGHTLATASGDDTARLWETSPESVTARICSIAWPAITKDEWDQYLPDLAYRPPCP